MDKAVDLDDLDPGKKAYRTQLRNLQIELVKLQRHIIAEGEKILIIFEGRDAAGKDGAIKRITEHLSPRETRVVALGKPSDREQNSWYYQRWVPHLPAAEELVLFNRSWYNRAGVERVMGFCSEDKVQEFFEIAPHFEQMLVRSGIKLFKYYLDITHDEQSKRLKERRTDPLKQWKISPIDKVAESLWKEYSEARNEMLTRTHSPISPWTIVRADNKRLARLNIISDLLARLEYEDQDNSVVSPNGSVVFSFDPGYFDNGMIAP